MTSSTRTARVRDQLRGLALGGHDLPTFAQSALELLQRAVPFEASCVASVDPATRLITDTVKLAIDDSRDQEWAHFEYEVDDVAKFVDLAHRPDPVTTVEFETAGDPARSARLGEFLRPNFQLGHELRAAARADGAVWAGICLFRGEDGRGFSAAEVDFVQEVAPALAVGVRMGLLVAAVGDSGISGSGPAVIIVDEHDQVSRISPGAAVRVEELSGGRLEQWGLLPMSLLSLVHSARAFAQGRYPHPPKLRVRTAAGEWLVAHATLLASRDDGPNDVVVTIEAARPPEVIPLLVAAHGLTPREQEVVQLVLSGIDTTGIARSLHMSTYTVQDHLKSIFDKTDVRSRRELMAKVFFDHYAPRMGSGLAPSGWFVEPADS